MDKLVTPFRVGLLLLLALCTFVVFFTFVRKGGLGGDSLRCWALFHDASGLGPKSRILIAGIPVGEIVSVTLEGNLARVNMRIKRGVSVRIDATLAKRSESLLGDYQLDLTPGRSPELLPDGGQIKNVIDVGGMEQVFSKLSRITGDIQSVTGALRETLGGQQGAANMQHIFENLSQISDQLNKAISANGKQLDAILANFQAVSSDVRTITGSEQERYQEIVMNVQRITESIQSILDQVKAILGTGQGNMKETVASLKQTLNDLDTAVKNVQAITDKVNTGKGTLGRLINDKRMGDSLSQAVTDVSDYADTLVSLQTKVTLRSEYLLNEGQTKTTLQLAIIPKPDKFYTLGITDDPQGYTTQEFIQNNPPSSTQVTRQTVTTTKEQLKFSAQFNKRWGFATAHFGIIENSGGFGVDLHFLHDALALKTDVFDFTAVDRNYPRLRSSLNYSFLHHIFISGGVDDILNSPVRDPDTQRVLSGRDFFLGGGIYFTDDDLKAILGTTGIPKP